MMVMMECVVKTKGYCLSTYAFKNTNRIEPGDHQMRMMVPSIANPHRYHG